MTAISVIVPVYNVEAYLGRCIDSILVQSFEDFELFLIDDGSPDRCGEICDEYAKRDKRIHVIHQQNKGLSEARNAGIECALHSDSEWITFIDSDDWVHPKYLQALIECAARFDADLVIGEFEKTHGEEPNVIEERLNGVLVEKNEFFITRNVVATVAWGKLYKKNLFLTIRYPAGKIHEDEFTTYKVLFSVEKVAYIDQPIYAYYQNQHGIMGRGWNPRRMDVYEAYDEQLVFFKDNPPVFAAQAKRYLANMNAVVRKLENEENSEYKQYKDSILKRLRKILLKTRKAVRWKDIPEISERAFPRYMYFYWIIHAQVTKVKSVFKKN